MSARPRWDVRGLVVPAGLLALAEVAARLSDLQSDTLAPPSAALLALFRSLTDGRLLQATGETLACALSGLAIGFALGAALGCLLGMLPVLNRLLLITVETVRPVPSVALIPIALLVFGFGFRMEVAIVAFAATWPSLILTRAAVASVEPRLFEVTRMLGLGLAGCIAKVVLPAIVARTFVALRLALSVSLVVAVTTEVSANTIGLGHDMMLAEQGLRPDLMLAFLFWIGFLGWLANAGMLVAQRRFFGASVAEADR